MNAQVQPCGGTAGDTEIGIQYVLRTHEDNMAGHSGLLAVQHVAAKVATLQC